MKSLRKYELKSAGIEGDGGEDILVEENLYTP